MSWTPHCASAFAQHSPLLKRLDHTAFLYDRYEWKTWRGSHYGLHVVMLTQGYFTFVDDHVVDKVARHSWFVNIQKRRDTGIICKVYAAASIKGENTYLHRFVSRAGKGVIIDHYNGLSLDNRLENLRPTNTHINNAGIGFHYRTKHDRLSGLRGVEIRRGKFGWQLKHNGRTYRSQELWDTPEAAHAEYLIAHAQFFGSSCVAFEHARKNYPVFPPTKEEIRDPDYIPF